MTSPAVILDFPENALNDGPRNSRMRLNGQKLYEEFFSSKKKYSTLHTGIQDQLEYCLLLADKDPKVEQSCLQTIFNSDFFWE